MARKTKSDNPLVKPMMRDLVIRGVEAHLTALSQEVAYLSEAIRALRGEELQPATKPRRKNKSMKRHTNPASVKQQTPKARRKKMTLAARKAVGIRMKQYWAERRNASK